MATTRKTGVHTLSDLLGYDDQTVLEFGEDTVATVIQNDLRALNARVTEQLQVFVGPTVYSKGDRLDRYGVSRSGQMVKADEFGRPVAKKSKGGINVGYPMDKYTFALGWTYEYLAMQTPADIAQDASAAIDAYLNRINREMQRAIYLTSNYTFPDELIDDLDLPVKRLLNADGTEIPNGPNGQTFDGSTHTHYDANNGWDNAALAASVSNLTEHGHEDGIVIFIHESDESAVSALADFKEFRDPRLIATEGETIRTIDVVSSTDRAIGLFKSATVWVKPWALPDYAFITALRDPRRPLKRRDHPSTVLRGLRTQPFHELYPIRTQIMQAYIGFGVWSRSNGVVHYAGGATYTDPTIAA